MNVLDEIVKDQIRSDLPELASGDTVKVSAKVVEGNRSRVQVFQGVVIRVHGSGVGRTFTVRKVSFGVGVERTFPLNSPIFEQIEIVTVLDPAVGSAHVDPSQLANSVLNMAINSRDAMPEGGKLILETRRLAVGQENSKGDARGELAPGAYVMVSVRDSGTGMRADVRDRVFEPFFTTKDVGKGTGLGLSMVYGFIKQSGGHIKVYSEESHGTTIKLYLPRAGEKAAWLTEILPPKTVEGGRETILLVEDEAVVRQLVAEILETTGYAVLQASDGPSALELLRRDSYPIDLLLTGDRHDPVLILGRAVGLEWATVRALIVLRLGPGRVPSATDIEAARLNFERLAASTAQRVVNFWQTRQTA